MREEMCNKMYIVLPATPNVYAPTLPCNTSDKSNIHSCRSEFLRTPFLQRY